jgi:hypothetical protein
LLFTIYKARILADYLGIFGSLSGWSVLPGNKLRKAKALLIESIILLTESEELFSLHALDARRARRMTRGHRDNIPKLTLIKGGKDDGEGSK